MDNERELDALLGPLGGASRTVAARAGGEDVEAVLPDAAGEQDQVLLGPWS